ncbi:MAG TPA: MotA/TolQ/ExbB proton channel family protein [Zeimonas sp.]|nr:MotA/TolQ/ExbB proton channel family protein [Zeimonas sp.]
MGSSLGFAHFLEHADAIAWGVLALLTAMSLASWYWIGLKGLHWLRTYRASRAFLASFPDLVGAGRQGRTRELAGTDPYARLARTAFDALERHRASARDVADAESREAFVARALKRSIAHQCARLEAGQTLLATVASTAPFVGLFGTVWGIYHALLAIGDAGAAGLQEVAGPVGEALIMTGIGLAVAIPASMAYNAFARARRNLRIGLDAFAHDLLVHCVDDAPGPPAESGDTGTATMATRAVHAAPGAAGMHAATAPCAASAPRLQASGAH